MVGEKSWLVVEVDALGFFHQEFDIDRERDIWAKSFTQVDRREPLQVSYRVCLKFMGRHDLRLGAALDICDESRQFVIVQLFIVDRAE